MPLAKLPPRPLVSVCMPVHNEARYLRESLVSLLTQTYQPLEIVVVDDGSSDSTPQILSSFTDDRLRCFRNPQNLGQFATQNRAIALARGELIAIRHSDDVYDPDMIEREVHFLMNHPEAGAVFCLDRWSDQCGRVLGHTRARLPHRFQGGGVFDLAAVLPELLRHRNIFLRCPTAILRADVFKAVGPFAESGYGTAADLEMWLRILAHYPVALLDEELMSYRVSPSQQSRSFDYLRVEPDPFFRIVDAVLAQPAVRDTVPSEALQMYELYRVYDQTFRAVNLFLRREPRWCRELLKEGKIPWPWPRVFAPVFVKMLLMRTLLEAGLRHAPRQPIGRALYFLSYPELRRGGFLHRKRPCVKGTPQERLRGPALWIDPMSEHFYDDALFDASSRYNRDGCLEPFIYLRQCFEEQGIPVHTADLLLHGHLSAEQNIYCSFGITKNYQRLAKRSDTRLSAFFAFETMVVAPELYRRLPDVARHFTRVFSWSDSASLRPFTRQDVPVQKFYLPQPRHTVFEELWQQEDRRFLTLINSNKRARLSQGELYTERLRAITFFSQCDGFDLYGVGWDEPVPDKAARQAVARCYRGAPRAKYATLAGYRFAICYENMVCPGWITEKIFDCFYTGTIPVYLGAPDIAEHVPADCFIDRRQFDSYADLLVYLTSLTAVELAGYRERARAYLASERFRPFRKESFTALLANILWEDSGVLLGAEVPACRL